MDPRQALHRPRPRVSELVEHLWQPLRRSPNAPASCYVLNISTPRPRAHHQTGEIPPVGTRLGDRSDRDAGGSGRRGRALMCLGPGRRALAARGRYGHCTWARRLRNGHSRGTLTSKHRAQSRRRHKSVRGCGAAHGSVAMHTGTHYAHAACMPTPRPACTTYILKYKVGTRPHVQHAVAVASAPACRPPRQPRPAGITVAARWKWQECSGGGEEAAWPPRGGVCASVRPCVWCVCRGGGNEGMVGVAASAAVAAAGAGLPSPSPGEHAVELELEEEEVVRRKWHPERTEWCDPGGTSARAARRPPRATP